MCIYVIYCISEFRSLSYANVPTLLSHSSHIYIYIYIHVYKASRPIFTSGILSGIVSCRRKSNRLLSPCGGCCLVPSVAGQPRSDLVAAITSFRKNYCALLVRCRVNNLISNWPIRFQEIHGFSFLIGQFDINSFPSLTTDLQIAILTGPPPLGINISRPIRDTPRIMNIIIKKLLYYIGM